MLWYSCNRCSQMLQRKATHCCNIEWSLGLRNGNESIRVSEGGVFAFVHVLFVLCVNGCGLSWGVVSNLLWASCKHTEFIDPLISRCAELDLPYIANRQWEWVSDRNPTSPSPVTQVFKGLISFFSCCTCDPFQTWEQLWRLESVSCLVLKKDFCLHRESVLENDKNTNLKFV